MQLLPKQVRVVAFAKRVPDPLHLLLINKLIPSVGPWPCPPVRRRGHLLDSAQCTAWTACESLFARLDAGEQISMTLI